MENEQKAKEIADEVEQETDYKDTAAYEAAIKMAELKDEEHNECKKDILTLVNLIPCNEENESIINDIKALLK